MSTYPRQCRRITEEEPKFESSLSKQKFRRTRVIELIRLQRENATQNLGFASLPFVLCGLPIKRPAKGTLLHERRNGHFLLQVTGHPQYGIPWGRIAWFPSFSPLLPSGSRRKRSVSGAPPNCSIHVAISTLDWHLPVNFRSRNHFRNRTAKAKGGGDHTGTV